MPPEDATSDAPAMEVGDETEVEEGFESAPEVGGRAAKHSVPHPLFLSF